jgi:hypothetical protein
LALVPQFIPLLYGMLEQTGARLETSHQLLAGQPIPGTALLAEKLGHLTEGGQTYAVNLPPAESRLRPLPDRTFASLNLPISGSEETTNSSPQAVRLGVEALEGQQKYWLILLAALIWTLGVETWLANRPVSRPTA